MTSSAPFRVVNRSVSSHVVSNRFLKIVQFNCNGLSSKLSEVKLYVFTTNPDVVCLCETWIRRRPPRFPGYQVFWNHRVDGPGGGLGILVRDDISCTILDLSPYVGSLEVQAVNLMSRLGLISIFNLYNPCKNISVEEFSTYIQRLSLNYIIVGDFNAHSPLWDVRGRSNMTGRSLEQLIEDGLLGLVSEPFASTYIDRRSGASSVLDLCLSCSALLAEGRVEGGPDLGSDHTPIVCTFGLELSRSDLSIPGRWLVKRGDWTGWFGVLASKEVPLFVPASVDELNEQLCNLVLAVSRDFIPLSSGRLGCQKSTPWWDAGCAKAVALRRRARNILSRTPSQGNLLAYKRACAVARFTILQKKRSSWQTFVSSLSPRTSLQKFWRVVRSMGGHSRSHQPVRVGGPEAPLALKAEFLAEHFVKQLPYSGDAFHLMICDTVKSFSSCDIKESVYNRPFALHELKNCLKSCSNTSPGLDNMSNLFFQRLPCAFLEYFVYLFNSSFFLSVVPANWKTATVCPIPKPNKDPLTVLGYRPISLLSCVGKLMERVLKVRLEHFLESNRVFSCFQAGFRRGHSTYDSLALLRQSISAALGSSSFCVVVYLDLENAYDRVWPDAVLYKLHKLGCDLRTILWLRSYFQGRSLRVRIGTTFSSFKPLACGLPQGAVLSPLLFNVLLHDMPKSDVVRVVSYADDISLVCIGKHFADVVGHMQGYLASLTEWLHRWRLVVNVPKSSYQVFTRKRFTLPVPLSISGQFLSHQATQRVLGVVFDAPRLTFASHISLVRTDCLRRLQVMRALSGTKWGSSWLSLRRIYISFVRSKLCYGSVVVFPCAKYLMSRLKSVENSALRCILGARKTTPILSLEVEAYVWPFDLHVQFTFLKWYLRLLSGPCGLGELPNYLDTSFLCAKRFLGDSPALFDSVKASLKQSLPSALYSPVPPVFDVSSLISFDVPNLSIVPPTQVNSIFGEFLSQRYPGFCAVYTDGSRLESPSVAAGMYVPSLSMSVSWLLNPLHSVVGAELFAILQVLRFVSVDTCPLDRVVVLCDSQSALHIIGNSSSPSYRGFSAEIQTLMYDLCARVRLQWVPAHCGILGNEAADRCANLGHSNSVSARTKLHFEELVSLLRASTLTEWRCRWHERVLLSGRGGFLSGILDKPVFRRWFDLPSRRLSCVVSRLRMGHVGVLSHLHRFNLSDTATCAHCSVPETVQHFLLTCTRYSRSRAALRAVVASVGADFTLQSLLGCGDFEEHIQRRILRALVSFLSASGRLHSL